MLTKHKVRYEKHKPISSNYESGRKNISPGSDKYKPRHSKIRQSFLADHSLMTDILHSRAMLRSVR